MSKRLLAVLMAFVLCAAVPVGVLAEESSTVLKQEMTDEIQAFLAEQGIDESQLKVLTQPELQAYEGPLNYTINGETYSSAKGKVRKFTAPMLEERIRPTSEQFLLEIADIQEDEYFTIGIDLRYDTKPDDFVKMMVGLFGEDVKLQKIITSVLLLSKPLHGYRKITGPMAFK